MKDELKDKIREIQNFPKKGINFKDITPIFEDISSFRKIIDEFVRMAAGRNIAKIAAIDARGFLIASALADRLGAGIALVRKKGKLPALTVESEYELEYGTAVLEIHKDAVKKGERVLIVDDVLATGGTAKATAELIEKIEGEVAGLGFMIELSFLNGRSKLKDYEVFSLVNYDE